MQAAFSLRNAIRQAQLQVERISEEDRERQQAQVADRPSLKPLCGCLGGVQKLPSTSGMSVTPTMRLSEEWDALLSSSKDACDVILAQILTGG